MGRRANPSVPDEPFALTQLFVSWTCRCRMISLWLTQGSLGCPSAAVASVRAVVDTQRAVRRRRSMR